jgi:hypothetical protein
VANVFYSEHANDREAFYYGTLMFFALQSAALLGSVYFGKYSYIKTAITLTLVFLFFAMVLNFFMKSIMPSGYMLGTFTKYVFYSGNNFNAGRMVQLPEWIGKSIEFLILYAFPPIFWTATYFRLKEKEV